MYLVSAAQMRELDRLTIEDYDTPGQVLMERAGIGATRVLLDFFHNLLPKRAVVVAGKGNNGGDANRTQESRKRRSRSRSRGRSRKSRKKKRHNRSRSRSGSPSSPARK